MNQNFIFISFLALTILMVFLVFKHYLKEISLNRLIKIALVAAIYAALTIGLAPISYGPIQFRLSEVLVLLAFIDPLYVPGLVLGCVIANLTSPFGIMDVFIGSFATFAAVYMITKSKNLFIASLCPAINGIFIGAELYFLTNAPLIATILYVALGELAVVTLIGYPLFKVLTNNNKLVSFLRL